MKNLRYSLLLPIVLLINFYFIFSITHSNTLPLVLAQLEPISTIEKVSDKGYYLVQFKSGLGPTTPEIPIDIVFLNATSPTGNVENDPVYSASKEGGDTALAEDKQLSVPVNYNTAPVQNYDLTIYDDQGDILWHKTNNDLYGISGKHFITLGDYKGNMTISINNITMLPSVEETILERQSSFSSPEETTTDKTLKDSVKFDVFLDSNNTIKVKPTKNEFTIRPG